MYLIKTWKSELWVGNFSFCGFDEVKLCIIQYWVKRLSVKNLMFLYFHNFFALIRGIMLRFMFTNMFTLSTSFSLHRFYWIQVDTYSQSWMKSCCYSSVHPSYLRSHPLHYTSTPGGDTAHCYTDPSSGNLETTASTNHNTTGRNSSQTTAPAGKQYSLYVL